MKTRLVVALIVLGGFVVGGAVTAPAKRKVEKKEYESQKELMKDMGLCFKGMLDFYRKVEQKKFGSRDKKGLRAEAAKWDGLAQDWKPFVKKEKAVQLQAELAASSAELVKFLKRRTLKRERLLELMKKSMAVCGGCHKGYRKILGLEDDSE